MTRILYIPTNRPAATAVSSALRECRQLAHITGERYVFLLVEHVDAQHVTQHNELLASGLETGVASSEVSAAHLTVKRWSSALNRLLDDSPLDSSDRARARELLTRGGVTYSSGPNKAFLVAASLGVDILHRRDSDHVPDRDITSSDAVDGELGQERFPGAMEVQAIGRRLGDVAALHGREDLSEHDLQREVSFVGSGMFGDPAHDRRELIAAGEDFGSRVLGLSSPWLSAESRLRDVRGYFTTEAAVRYDDDFFAVDDSGRTELGVSCLRRVFLQLPEMPIPDTLGCDYFGKNLLYQQSRPVIFQSRKMRHDHDTARRESSLEQFVEYSLRDLRYVVLWPIWSRHNESIRAGEGFMCPDGTLDADRYASSFRAALDDKGPEALGVASRFAQVYRDAAETLERSKHARNGNNADRLRAVATAAESLGDIVVEQVATGIGEYCWLIERWEHLVEAAPAARKLIDMRPVSARG